MARLLLVEDEPGLVLTLTDRLTELLAHAERIEVPGTSRLMHEENASAYKAAVQCFLTRRRQAT